MLEQCTWPTNDIPSWVPDWTDTEHFRLFSGPSTYHTTKGSVAHFRFGLSDQSLSCQGCKIDEIDGLGESYFEDLTTHRLQDAGNALVQSRGNNNAYGSEDALKEALWNTFVGGRDLRGRKAPAIYQCLLECSPWEEDEASRRSSRGRTAFHCLITQSADLMIAEKTLSSHFYVSSASNDEELREPLERVYRFVRTRRLMVTLKGLIGAVPHEARRGDIVFLLLGCNVPIVLRAVGNDRYKVVGSCYLHGIMEGEAMGPLEAGQSHVKEIILC